jgi:predicted RNase H-like nuclease (RuvC/YqgF family)
MARYA